MDGDTHGSDHLVGGCSGMQSKKSGCKCAPSTRWQRGWHSLVPHRVHCKVVWPNLAEICKVSIEGRWTCQEEGPARAQAWDGGSLGRARIWKCESQGEGQREGHKRCHCRGRQGPDLGYSGRCRVVTVSAGQWGAMEGFEEMERDASKWKRSNYCFENGFSGVKGKEGSSEPDFKATWQLNLVGFMVGWVWCSGASGKELAC